LLEVYEEQIGEYLKTFHIPLDYQSRILHSHRRLQAAYDNTDSERAKWEVQLETIRELCKWGDISREWYLKEMKALGPPKIRHRISIGWQLS